MGDFKEGISSLVKKIVSGLINYKKIIIISGIVFLTIALSAGAIYFLNLKDAIFEEGDWSNVPFVASQYTSNVTMNDDGTLTSSMTAQELWDKLIAEGSNIGKYLRGPKDLLRLMNAEVITQFPDTREDPDKEFEWDKINKDVNSNLLQGIIKIKRAWSDGKKTTLSYVDPETFQSYIDDYNSTGSEEAKKNAMSHFTLGSKQGASNSSSSSNSSTSSNGKIVVLDAGHGKKSSLMTDSEKSAEGYVKNNGSWGEWRHWKSSNYGTECLGLGCIKTGSNCWYPIGNGDRDMELEPSINLNNTLATKKYLEQKGYTVRMARSSNDENPSFTKRSSYCFANNDTSKEPDASLYVCIHSNAGGGSGTSYIAAEGKYDQKYIPSDYITQSNNAGKLINDKVAEASGLSNNGAINNEGWLIAFNKNPVPTAYLEIGFFDNASDLAILRSKSDAIGKAIADGIDEYLKGSNVTNNNVMDSGDSNSAKTNLASNPNTSEVSSTNSNSSNSSSATIDSLNNVLVIGDSIASFLASSLESEGAHVIYQGSGNANFFLEKVKSPSVKATNAKLKSGNYFDWSQNIDTLSKPKAIYLILGQNTTATNEGQVKSGAAEIKELADKLHNQFPGIPIFINGVVPTSSKYKYNDLYTQMRPLMNDTLKSYCNGNDYFKYMDIYNNYIDNNGHAIEEMVADGIHPSIKGISTLVSNIKSGINGTSTNSSNSGSTSATTYYAIVAKWSETNTTVTTNDPQETASSNTTYSMTTTNINYQEFVSGYTMPFDYLWALIVTGDDRDIGLELADLVQDSEIEITVHDNYSISTTSNSKSRTETIKTDDNKTKTVTYTTTTTIKTKSDNINVALTLADVWIVRYTQEFKYEGTKKENKYTSSPGVVEEKTDKEAQEPNFVTIFLKSSNSKSRRNILEVSSWLFEILESNESTKDMVDLTKYLLYKATGTDYGVTEFDFSIFDPKNFKKTNSGESFMSFLKKFIHYWECGGKAETNEDGTMYKIVNDGSGNAAAGYGVDIFNGGFAAEWQAAGYPTSIGSYVPVEFVDALEERELNNAIDRVNSICNGINLTGYQKVALVSRMYNMGPYGGLTNTHNGLNFVSAYQQYWTEDTDQYQSRNPNANFSHPMYTNYMSWTTHDNKGNYREGLERRRKSEWTLFSTGYFKELDEWYSDSGISMDDIDSSVQSVLEEVMTSWPSDMEDGRKQLIQKAASLVNKGCKYSMPLRQPYSDNPSYLDCSSYVGWSFAQTGHEDVGAASTTATYVTSKSFMAISESDLVPGDIALNNSSTMTGGANHVGIYIGKNSSGNNVYLHCTSSGINGPQVRQGNGNFAVFYRYRNW